MRHFGQLCILSALFVVCATQTGQPSAAAVPVTAASSSKDAITAGIQATLDHYATVVRAKQNDQIAALVDANGPPTVRRLLVNLAESYQDPSTSDLQQVHFRIRGWKQRAPSLAEVTVQRTWDERLHHGVSPTSDAIRLITSGIAFGSYSKPTRTKNQEPRTAAPGTSADFITHLGMLYYPWESFVQSVATVFRHEYTHRISDRATTLVTSASLPTWMSEGLAEHVAGEDHLAVPAFWALATNDTLMSVCELVESPEHVPVGILYGTAQQITTYIVDVKGGLPMFWQLADAYRRSSGRVGKRMELALQSTFSQSCSDFDRVWHAWSRERATIWQPPR